MADTMKKYIDNLSAQELINQIKGADTKVLQDSKDYADSLADNYDVAGSSASVKSELDAEVSRATAKENELAASIEGVKITADKATEDISAINNTETGILAQAKADAKGKADAVQANVDALEEKVGEIPTGEPYADITTVIGYVNKKAEETLAAAQGGSSETAASVKAALDTYKTENDAKVKANETAIANAQKTADDAQDSANVAQSHSEGVATDLATEKKAREDADTAQTGRIATLEEQIKGVTGAMHFEGIKDSVPTDVTGYEAGDVVIVGEKEYVFNGTAFVEFGDVSAEGERIGTLETKMQSAEEALAKKAEQSALEAESTARTEADTAMNTRLKAVEAEKHTHANQEELDKIVVGDKAKWDAMEQNAKDYSDSLNAAMTTKVEGVEGKADKNATDIANLTTEVDKKASATALSDEITRAQAKEIELENSIAQFVALTPEDIKTMWANATA